MILVDTSVWIDHLQKGDPKLAAMLNASEVLMHPLIVGELACGNLHQRSIVLDLLQALPEVSTASNEETMGFIDRYGLMGRGIGFIDAHLLAATALSNRASIWTRDKRLHAIADSLGLAYSG